MQPHVRDAIDGFLASLGNAADSAMSVVLYGSAAREEHVVDHSDLNLLIVAPTFTAQSLEALGASFEPLRAHSRTPPLLFTAAEWKRSTDVFPIEVADMQVAREVIRGSDPVGDLTVARSDLRRALERELRGKLLRLRQAYSVYARSAPDLNRVAVASAATLAALLRGTLTLSGEPPPLRTGPMLERARARLRFDAEPLERYYSLRGKAPDGLTHHLFERYLESTEGLVKFVDQFHVGGH